MSLLFGALFVHVYLHPLAFAFSGTDTPGKNQAHYLLVLATVALQSQWAICRDTHGVMTNTVEAALINIRRVY